MSAAAASAARREAMVERQIAGRGIRDGGVLAAMREVPRKAFIAEELADFAYEDRALPIAAGQTISQPYIVALMLEAAALRPSDQVLEIGVGSGYGAALASRMVRSVHAIDRHGELTDLAGERCARLGYDNIALRTGDGTAGWPEQRLVRVVRRGEEDFEEQDLGGVRFVPLIGEYGWKADGEGGAR